MKNEERLLTIIQKPHVSEKVTVIEAIGQYVFKVHPDANKVDIKKAVELLFKVKVDAVRVCNVKGKAKRHGKASQGHRRDWKKAYITLEESQKIDFRTVAV
jgi:large subunit ribosomal protein L23